jgi:hypothetical protein
MDNHESQVTIAAIIKARENSNIMLIFAHTQAIKLQPLDSCVSLDSLKNITMHYAATGC